MSFNPGGRYHRGGMHDGDAMRGIFGGVPRGAVNNNKRGSIDGLAARQAAVAEAYERAQKEKQVRAQRSNQVPETSLPQISPRANNSNFYQQQGVPAPPSYAQYNRREVPVARAPAPPSPVPMPDPDSSSSKLLSLVSAISNRLSSSEDQMSSLEANLDALNSNQSSLSLQISNMPTNDIITDLKLSIESTKSTLAEASKSAAAATADVNKLGLQVFEQQTNINSVLDLSKTVEQSNMVLDNLRLSVDELNSDRPMIKSIDNDISTFRREFHSRLAEESEFRDSVTKKNQVLFNELVRLGENVEKDRGNNRQELTEMAGIMTTVEKRLKSTEDGLDRSTKAHGNKLVNLDASMNTIENSMQAFGRDVQKVAGAVMEEQRARKNATDNLGSAIDDIRGAVSDRLGAAVANIDGKMSTMEEQIRSAMEGVRLESERGRSFISEEIKTVQRSVHEEATSRTQLEVELTTKIATSTEEMKTAVSDFQSQVNEQIAAMRNEETELAMQNVKNQEDIKNGMALLEKELYEMQSQANARVDRTRSALEEVLRAEIQSRQNNMNSLEGRVRDIVEDCMASLESVQSEGRMSVDALANRINSMEVSLTKLMDGKISVIEEAVAARQNAQEDVNKSFEVHFEKIEKQEVEEHVERVNAEDEIIGRVKVVEDRVEGEIEDIRQRVQKTRTEVKENVRELGELVDTRCTKVESDTIELRQMTKATENNLEIFNKVTNNNFEMVREDIVANRGAIDKVEEGVMDVDNKVGINNTITGAVDFVVGSFEGNERLTKEDEMKKFFMQYVAESEAKLVEKENERERRSKEEFERQVQSVRDVLETERVQMQEDFERKVETERKAGLEREEKIKDELLSSMVEREVTASVAVCVEGLVTGVAERISMEESEEQRIRSEQDRERLEKELAAEKERAGRLQDRLEELSVVVNERERLEGIEWSKILAGDNGIGTEGEIQVDGADLFDDQGAKLVKSNNAEVKGKFPRKEDL